MPKSKEKKTRVWTARRKSRITLVGVRSFRLLLLLALPLLSGCRYNFVPLIPPATKAPLALPTRITQASLVRSGEQLVLRARLEGKLSSGYLKVSWYDDSKKLAEDSVFLDADKPDATLTLTAPVGGAYRAVLAFEGVVLRQVELYEKKP